MILTSAQKTAVRNAILADPGVATMFTDGNTSGVADYMNAPASPAFSVWRTSVSRAEIYNETSPDATSWSWLSYKGQAVAEQNAWVQMFMGDAADFSKPNLRAGVASIFGAANAQTAHVLAMGRRLASRFEKILATGTGTAASPGTMVVEGPITAEDVQGL